MSTRTFVHVGRLAFFALVLMVSPAAMGQVLPTGVAQLDRDAIRKQAELPRLSEADIRRNFEQLKALVNDPNASADNRCDDFYLAVRTLARLDPAAAANFAEEKEREAWVTQASPGKRGIFTCGVAITYLATRQNEHAIKKLKEIEEKEWMADPMVEAVRAHGLLVASVALGRYAEADEWRNALSRAVDNTNLPIRVRTEYQFDVLQFLFDEGASNPELEKSIGRSELILRTASGEVADRLAVLTDIVRSQIASDAPAPTREASHAKIANRLAIVARLRKHIPEFKAKYGPAAAATIMASEGVASMNLEMAPFSKDAAALEAESLQLCDDLISAASSVMVENERIWLLKGVAAGMLRRHEIVRQCYNQVKKIQGDANLDPSAGLRFSRRLMLLGYLNDQEPAYVASEWSAGIAAFAGHVRSLAIRNPDLALTSLDAWNPIPMYGGIAAHGRPDVFLDGYVEATGIIKNVPYRRPETGRRLYGQVRLADVRRKLGPERPMLVYVKFQDPLSTNRQYYGGFYIDDKTIRYVDLGPVATIEAAIGKWRKSIRPPTEGGEGDPKSNGRVLYDRLIRPLIPAKVPGNLYIVPDQGMEAVSFATLRTPSSRWLVQDCAVTYLGAMRDLAAQEPSTVKRSLVLLQGDAYREHVRLGAAALSLRAMTSIDKSIVAQTATPQNLLNLRSPTYLHLSVHGEQRDVDDPVQVADASWLVLPGPIQSTKDLAFSARQVASLHLEGTRCVLLAACAAAKSKVLTGEGTGGLRRSFYIAGARSVISSLLLVQEDPASLATRRANASGNAPGDYLLAKIYQGLSRGRTPAEALRLAQLQVLRQPDTSSPLFWGGFICEGN